MYIRIRIAERWSLKTLPFSLFVLLGRSLGNDDPNNAISVYGGLQTEQGRPCDVVTLSLARDGVCKMAGSVQDGGNNSMQDSRFVINLIYAYVQHSETSIYMMPRKDLFGSVEGRSLHLGCPCHRHLLGCLRQRIYPSGTMGRMASAKRALRRPGQPGAD